VAGRNCRARVEPITWCRLLRPGNHRASAAPGTGKRKFESFSPTCILTSVKRFKTLGVLAVLALWLPLTQHCKLESIPGLEFLRCAPDAASNSDCSDDGCAAVESALFKCPDNSNQIFSPALVWAVFPSPVLPPASVAEANNLRSDAAPPELPTSWQFSLRTALPVRAPSLAS